MSLKSDWQISEEEHILIVDGLGYVYRSAINKLDGEFALLFNFFRNLRSTIENFEPTKVFFVWEGHPKHRYDLLPSYKANRIKMASDNTQKSTKDKVKEASLEVQRLLKYLPVTQVKHPDYEADDCIAFLCEDLKNEKCTIISGDSDLVQLLQKDYKKLKIFNYQIKDYVQPPEYNYLIYKCLAGDKKSDNIPSIVGPKTAEKLVNNLDSLKEFLSNEEKAANFRLNKDLIELKAIPSEGIEFTYPEIDFEYIKSEFERMEFKSIINENSWITFTRTFKALT